jgi:hypothetical protein
LSSGREVGPVRLKSIIHQAPVSDINPAFRIVAVPAGHRTTSHACTIEMKR